MFHTHGPIAWVFLDYEWSVPILFATLTAEFAGVDSFGVRTSAIIARFILRRYI